MLDKISGAVLIGARQRQARVQLLAGVVEQLLVDSKRARDADAAAMNMQLVTWRDGRAANEAFVAGSGRRAADVASAVADRMETRRCSLNLLPTVQQAISNLLTVYEPEFLRFGYGLFLSFATILIVWQGIRMMFSHDGLGEQMFDFAKLLLFVSFGYALITFYEAPIPGHRRVVQQPDHGPGALLPERARGAGVRQHLPPLRRTGRPLHAAGRVVDPREPDLLDGAAPRSRSRRRCRSP